MLNGINRSKLSFKCVYGFVYKDIYGGRSMIIEVTNAEKRLIEHSLIRLSLEKQDGPFYKESDIKELWIKLHFGKHELEPVPEYFLLEESDNV